MELLILIGAISAPILVVLLLFCTKTKKNETVIVKKQCQEKKSEIINQVNIGAIGLIEDDDTFFVNGYDEEIDYKIEVQLVSKYGVNRIKVKIINVLFAEPTDDSNSIATMNKIISEFNERYFVGNELIVYNNKVDWEDNEIGSSVSISNKDLSKLVKTGEVNIDGLNVKLTEDWDYKRALEIVIES